MITKALRQFKYNDDKEGIISAYDIEEIDSLIDDLKECNNCDNSYFVVNSLCCKLPDKKSFECVKELKYKLWVHEVD